MADLIRFLRHGTGGEDIYASLLERRVNFGVAHKEVGLETLE